VRAGHPPEAIVRCPPGAEDVSHPAIEHEAQPWVARGVDAAMLMDLPDDRPEACNVTLPSHMALWRALQSAVRRNADGYRDALAGELLDDAQQESGTSLADPQVREHFVTLLRIRIAPATLARTSVETLLAQDCRVAVWGDNWPEFGAESDIRRGPIPTGEGLIELLRTARVVVLPDTSAWSVQTALDALAAGTAVVCRAADAPFEREYPELADLTRYLHFYRSQRGLADLVHRLSLPVRTESRESREARLSVAARHTVARRLQFIVDTLRRPAATAAARERADVVGV